MAVSVIEGADAWQADGEGERSRIGVVVVHGFTGNPISTRPLGEHLHGAGYTVDVLRLPGHGTSVQDMAGTRYADWLATVEQAHDDLAARCDQVVLVGLSMGGTLCLDVGARRDVAGVVTVNAQVLDPEGLVARFAGLLQHVIPMVPAAAAGIAEDDIKAGGTEQAYDQVPAKAGYSLTSALPRVRAQLPQLTAPTLVCWSTEDHTVPPKNSHQLVGMLGGEVRTLELTDSYHVATLDNDQALLFATIADFVADVTGV